MARLSPAATEGPDRSPRRRRPTERDPTRLRVPDPAVVGRRRPRGSCGRTSRRCSPESRSPNTTVSLVMHPVGPRTSRVYWFRRVTVGVLALVVVVGVVWFVVRKADGTKINTAAETSPPSGSMTGVLATSSQPPDTSHATTASQTTSSNAATSKPVTSKAVTSKAVTSKATAQVTANTAKAATTPAAPGSTSRPAGSTAQGHDVVEGPQPRRRRPLRPKSVRGDDNVEVARDHAKSIPKSTPNRRPSRLPRRPRSRPRRPPMRRDG